MPVFLSSFFIFFLFGCYNNSHIRTQRVLQENEKVFSVSGSYNALGIVDERIINKGSGFSGAGIRPYVPVAAIRAEISVLEGFKHGELGYSIGGGVNAMVDQDLIGLIGVEYNKYLQYRRERPLKAGMSLELNRTSSGLFTLHSIQSFKTTTTKKAPFFVGFHTLFSKTNIKESHRSYAKSTNDYYLWNSYPVVDEVTYDQTTRGFGVSSGIERFFVDASLMLQFDVSFVKNSINNLKEPFVVGGIGLEREASWSWPPIVSASLALNFSPKSFKKIYISKKKDSVKSQAFQDWEILKKPQIIEFDPETGERIEKKTTDVMFDPETGEIIKQ